MCSFVAILFYDSNSWMEMFFDTLFELRAWIGEQCIGSLHGLRVLRVMVGCLAARLEDRSLVQYSSCHSRDTVSRQLQEASFPLKALIGSCVPIECGSLFVLGFLCQRPTMS